MFPVYILEKGTQLPEKGTFYVVASNGVFIHKETGIVHAMVKVDGVSFLEKLNATATLMLPKLSPELVVRTLLFFRAVYRKHHSEAMVLIYYSTESQEYLLWCPEQEVSAAGVEYDSDERFEGFQLVGTIHSHNNFGAFHSGVDISDERNFDGVHITIGRLDQPYFTISCSIVVNDNRFRVEPGNVINGITEVEWKPKTQPTYRRKPVQRQTSGILNFGSLIDLGLDEDDGFTSFFPSHQSSQFYDMVLPDGQDYRNVGFPSTWMDKVKKRTFVQTVVGAFSQPKNLKPLPQGAKGGEDTNED